MTVTTTNSQISYTGDGTSVTFPFPYYFLAATDIQVYINGVLQTSGYTVAGAGSQLGGAVSFTTAPIPGAGIILLRSPDTLQNTDFPPNDPFPSSANERALDKLTMLCQLIVNKLSKTLSFPIYETFSGILASASQRASTLLGFDDAGNVTYLPVTASIGAGDMRVDTFTAGLQFTPGVTTQLTLSRAPGNTANLEIFYDGFFQGPDQWGVNGTTVTFNTPIPVGVSKVFARIGTTLSTQTPPVGSVGSSQIAAGAVGDPQLAWGAILNRVVNTIASLRSLDKTKYARAFVTGYYASGDGGGGAYWYDPTDTVSTDNGGTVIVAADGGRWKLSATSRLSVLQFGAKGDAVTDDRNACQAAADATPIGGTLYFPGGRKYRFASAVRITKPMTILGDGPGSLANDLGSYIIQTNTAANAFTLVASQGNYAFGQYGIVDVHFRDIAITGNAIASRSARGIGVDTSVNGGDFHIRECTFTNVNLRYFQSGYDLQGIAYLNRWYAGCVNWCDNGLRVARGASSDVGGQNRLFGTTFDLNGTCISYFEDALGGAISLFGCTLSDSAYGLRVNQATQITVDGNEFENNTSGGTGCSIYLPITDANPTAAAVKTIIGNKFIGNDADIWVDKTSSGSSDGNFNWAALIDGNYFGSATALRISVPAGHQGMCSPLFVLGASNGGLNAGAVADSQISSNFLGTDMRKRRITRRFPFTGSFVSGSVLITLPVGFSVLSVRCYLTANAGGASQYQVGDQTLATRYLNFNAQTQTLNTWVTFTPTPDILIISNINSLRLVATGGMLGGAGVIEIDGYTP